MGDRRIAQIHTKEGDLYFYTHSSGYRLPEMAQEALDRASVRKNDQPYALRIVIDHMIYLSGSRDSELNSGIMFTPDRGEDEYSVPFSVTVDMVDWTVTGRREVRR
tara:strand:- start:362 stop:679 length:318 start_codon:yes stop_codon:yes gene_type:complete